MTVKLTAPLLNENLIRRQIFPIKSGKNVKKQFRARQYVDVSSKMPVMIHFTAITHGQDSGGTVGEVDQWVKCTDATALRGKCVDRRVYSTLIILCP